MRRQGRVRSRVGAMLALALAATVVGGMLVTRPVWAGGIATQHVALHAGHHLCGATEASAWVFVAQEGKLLTKVQADPQGKFRVSGLKAGEYTVASKSSRGLSVKTTPQAAPVAATKGAGNAHTSGCCVSDCVPKCQASPVIPPPANCAAHGH